MIQISPLILLALGELLLISIVLTLWLTLSGVIRRRKERQAIAKLVGRIKQDEVRRREETRTLMQENYGFEGQDLEAIVNKIAREEKRLYQALINLFLRRDLNIMEVLHVECEGATEPYRTLEIPRPESTTQDDVESDLVVEVERLREENERLTTELGVTMDTMGTMLNEYASMYDGGAGGDLDKRKLAESFRAPNKDNRNNEPDAEDSAASAKPDANQVQAADASHDDANTGKTDAVTTVQEEQADSELLDDATDIDIGEELLEDETVVIEGMDELSVLSDETLVMDIGDDELVELDDEDLSLDKTILDNGQAPGDSDNKQKWAG